MVFPNYMGGYSIHNSAFNNRRQVLKLDFTFRHIGKKGGRFYYQTHKGQYLLYSKLSKGMEFEMILNSLDGLKQEVKKRENINIYKTK